MTVDLSWGALVDAAGGGLIAAGGAAIAVLGWPRAENRWLALSFVALGLRYAIFRPFGSDASLALLVFGTAFALELVSAVALAAYVWPQLRRTTSPAPVAVGAALGVVLIALFAFTAWPQRVAFAGAVDVSPRGAGLLVGLGSALLLRFLAASVFLFAAGRGAARGIPEWRGMLLCASGLSMAPARDLGNYIVPAVADDVWRMALLAVSPILAAVLSLLVVRGPGQRASTQAALAVLAIMVVGAFEELLALPVNLGPFVRVAAMIPILWGLFLLGGLQVPVRLRLRRATLLAGIGLATLLSATQVLQNVLSDSLGLLAGGVAAGLAVFVAFPFQRIAEARLATGHEESFRLAVRLAGGTRGTPGGERELLVLAGRLGLTTEQATRILHEPSPT